MARLELIGTLISTSLILVVPPATVHAQATGSGTSSGVKPHDGGSGGDPTKIPAAVSPGWNWYRPYVIVQATPDGGTVSTLHVPYGSMGMWMAPTPSVTPAAPAPPTGLVRPVSVERPRLHVKKADRERAELVTTFGDRMFRIGNYKRAEERYEQAVKLNPFSAAPRMRLAQLALVRERYTEAADRLREAETAEPGWVVTARDVQSLYAEPADFARHVARLEAHLHKEPEDRDAWLVLGAQWFLSRRESKAADVFLRLDDPRHKPDIALAAFMDAARLRETTPQPPPVGDAEPVLDQSRPPSVEAPNRP